LADVGVSSAEVDETGDGGDPVDDGSARSPKTTSDRSSA
jgi:hypothetical protein